MKIENEMTKEEFDKEQKRLKREKWEIMFQQQLETEGFYLGDDPENLLAGEYIREYKWHPKRRWRSDFLIADPDGSITKYDPKLILVEIEGGTYSKGRHTRGSGFAKDAEKYNAAQSMGWKVYRFPSEMVKDGSAIKFLREEVWKTT